MDIVARWLAEPVQGDRLTIAQPGGEDRDNAGLAVSALARPIDVTESADRVCKARPAEVIRADHLQVRVRGVNAASDATTFVLTTLVFITAAGLAGYGPIRALFGPPTWLSVFASPPLGMVAVVSVCGLTAIYYPYALGVVVPLLCLLLIAIGITVMARDALRRSHRLRRSSDLWCGLLVLVSAVALGAWQIHAVFGLGPLATVSMNNDLLSYAYMGRHLADFGTGQPGWIVGFDAGSFIRSDVIGAIVILIPTGLLAGDTMHATMPLMSAVTSMVALAGFVLLRQILQRRAFLAATAGVLMVTGYAATYNSYQYFLAEKIGILILLVSATTIIASRRAVYVAGWQTAVTIALIATYPQMVPLQLLIAIVIAASCVGASVCFRRIIAVRRASAVVVGTIVGGVLLAPYVVDRIDRARLLLDVVAGWPMPTFSLLEMLGIRDPFVGIGRPAVTLVETAMLGLVLVVLLTVVRRTRRMTVIALLGLLLPAVVFLRFASVDPDSYRQWKAMAWAAPFVILVVVATIALVAEVVFSRYGRVRLSNAIPIAIVLVWLVMAFSSSFNPTPDIEHCSWGDCPISAQVRSELAGYAKTAGTDTVTIARGSHWPSMTAAYFLWGRPIVMRDPTYWPISTSPTRRTLSTNGWTP